MLQENQKLKRALALHQAGRLTQAAKIYRQISSKNPDDVHALHYLGMIEAASGNIAEARALMARSLSGTPPNVRFIENYATLLTQAGAFTQALEVCRQGLAISGASLPLLLGSAIALFKLGRLTEALAQFDRLLLLHKDHAEAFNERGGVLLAMKQHEAALGSFERALTLAPAMVEAHINRGTACRELERHEDALAAYDRTLALQPDVAVAWLGRGAALSALKQYDEALSAFDKAIGLAPNLAEAWLARGNAHFARRSHAAASTDYDQALALDSGLADAWLGRGNVLFAFRHYDEALRSYEKACAAMPEYAEAWLGRGNVLSGLKRFAAAASAYDQAKRLKPALPGVQSALHHAKRQICDWSDYEGEYARVLASVRNGELAAYPFEFLNLPSSSADQLLCARAWVAKEFPAAPAPAWHGRRHNHGRIHVAYVSADFNPHPVAYLIAGMFEHHDKARFETTGISIGAAGSSDIRTRIEASLERFIDARALSDVQIADTIRQLEVDILVDLNGFTGDGRTGIFAQRAAPIQINYLGYPGTSGADFMDYIIADRTVIPEDKRGCYSEEVIYLPDCYLVNDDSLPISETVPSRADLCLPQEGFVFCCFNNHFKITPDVFGSWMRILAAVEGSVLWLAEGGADASRNLRAEATARGIDSARLIFAERVPALPDHLARLRAADLFLDTLPYNAHATASHALWAGVPVLTRLGETFAGRVGASLLRAVGMPELVTEAPEAYECAAIAIAKSPEKQAETRDRLARNRLSRPLFDTKLLVTQLESAFARVHERHLAGLPTDHVQL